MCDLDGYDGDPYDYENSNPGGRICVAIVIGFGLVALGFAAAICQMLPN